MNTRLLAAFFLCCAGSSWAAPGALDTTFSGDGMLTTPIGSAADLARSVLVQPDGKVVAAGYTQNAAGKYDFALARYTTDGSLDASFDGDGIVTTPVGATFHWYLSAAIQVDGKLLVVGESADRHIALARYHDNGSLDTSFDADGMVATAVGAVYSSARSLIVQPDGKVVVAGSYADGATGGLFLARYNSNGNLDTGFDGDGIVTTASYWGSAVAVQPDGKLIVAGVNSSNHFAVLRYNSDGSLDSSFDGDGIVTTSIGFETYVYSVAVQPDGKLVVAGSNWTNGNYDDLHMALARYNSDGSLDTSFDGDGVVTTNLGTAWDEVYALAVQPDGKLVAAGYSADYSASSYAVVRYNSDGSLDTTFDADGIVITAVAPNDSGYAVAIQPDGKLVVAGPAGAPVDFGLLRYVATDTAWDLAATAFSFTDHSAVAFGSTRTAEAITVSGLDAGVKVPLQISGGSYSLNNGAYTSDMGWVQNGDTITVRHTAAANPSTATNTTLTLGGLVATNNPGVILGSTVSDVFTSTTEAADSTPDAFAFTDQTDVAFNVTVTSAAVSIAGINVATAISVADGEYSIGCTGVFTTVADSVVNGDTVCVRHTSGATYSSAVNTTLTIGGISDVFTSTTVGDAVPEPFSFTDVTGQALNTTATSNAITVSGLTTGVAIEVSGGEYSIGCTDSFTAASGAIANGELVCVRHTTSNAYAATVDTTLTIGGVSDIFSSTTVELDGTPDAFAFIDQTDVAIGAVVESDPVTITGINGPTAVSVAGGEYSVGCTGVYTATAGTLSDGDSVCVRHTASSTHAATINTTLTVGGVSDVFSSTTEAAPASGGGGGAIGGVWLLLMGLFGAIRAPFRCRCAGGWRTRIHKNHPRLGA